METDAGSSGYLAEDGQETLELGRLRDCDAVDKSRNEEFGVLQSVADVVFAFDEFTGTFVHVVGCPIEFACYGFAVRGIADKLVIHFSFSSYRRNQCQRVHRQRWQSRRMRQGGFRGSVLAGR